MSKLGVATWPFILAVLVRAEAPLSSGEVVRRAAEISRGSCSLVQHHVGDVLDNLAADGFVNNQGVEGKRNGWVITDAGRKRWQELVDVLGPIFGGSGGNPSTPVHRS